MKTNDSHVAFNLAENWLKCCLLKLIFSKSKHTVRIISFKFLDH